MSTQFRATEQRIKEAQQVADRNIELRLEILEEKIKLAMVLAAHEQVNKN